MFPDLRHGARVIVRDRDVGREQTGQGPFGRPLQTASGRGISVKSPSLYFIVSKKIPVYFHPSLAPSPESHIPGLPPAKGSHSLRSQPHPHLKSQPSPGPASPPQVPAFPRSQPPCKVPASPQVPASRLHLHHSCWPGTRQHTPLAGLLTLGLFHHPHLGNFVFQFCHLKKDITKLEKLQRRAAKLIQGEQGCQVRTDERDYDSGVWRDKGREGM